MNNYINRTQKSKYAMVIAKSIVLISLILLIFTSFSGSNSNYKVRAYKITDYDKKGLDIQIGENNDIYIVKVGKENSVEVDIYRDDRIFQKINFPITFFSMELEDISNYHNKKAIKYFDLLTIENNVVMLFSMADFIYKILYDIGSDKFFIDQIDLKNSKISHILKRKDLFWIDGFDNEKSFFFNKIYIVKKYNYYVDYGVFLDFYDYENIVTNYTYFEMYDSKFKLIKKSSWEDSNYNFKKILEKQTKIFPTSVDSKGNIICGFDYLSVNKELEKYNYEVLDKELDIYRGYTRAMMYIDANDNLWYSFDIIKKGNRKFDLNTYVYDKSYITDSRSCFAKFEKDKTGKYVLTGIYGPFNVSELDNWRIYCDDVCFVKDGKIYASIRKNIFEPFIEGKASQHELREYQREIWEIKVE